MSLVETEAPVAAAPATSLAPPQVRETYGELGLLHRSLAEHCRAGVPMSEALRMLHADLARRPLREACAEMARDIDEGMPLADAYARQRAHFPPLFCALLEAGVAGGDVPAVLDEIATHASLRDRVRDQLRQRLEYPLAAAAFVFVAGGALAFTIAPIGAGDAVVDGLRIAALTGPSKLLVGLGAVALAVVAAVVTVAVAFLRRPLDASGPRGLLYRLPVLGRLRSDAARAGFAATMALLLRRQLPLDRALGLCAATFDASEVQGPGRAHGAECGRRRKLGRQLAQWRPDSAQSAVVRRVRRLK